MIKAYFSASWKNMACLKAIGKIHLCSTLVDL